MSSFGRIGGLSSYLVNRGPIIVLFCLSLIANFYGHTVVSAMLMFGAVLGLISRVWGMFALKNVTLGIFCRSGVVQAGQSTEIEYVIDNDKLMPLIWLELSQCLPQNRCVLPDNHFGVYEIPDCEAGENAFVTVVRKKLAFIMWRQSVSFKSNWTARRRGVFQINKAHLRSGDGFGLSQCERDYDIPSFPTLVVYPAIVPVRTDHFYKTLSSGKYGARGVYEDHTVLRGTRDYQSSDSWKLINWRVAARQNQLQTRLFETVTPKTIHFIVDGASFFADNGALEEMLSILASIIMRLDENGVRCGISFPKSDTMPPVNLFASASATLLSDVLFQISAYLCSPGPSVFDIDGLEQAALFVGDLYYLTYDPCETGYPPVLGRLDAHCVTVVCGKPPGPKCPNARWLLDYRTMTLSSFKKEDPS